MGICLVLNETIGLSGSVFPTLVRVPAIVPSQPFPGDVKDWALPLSYGPVSCSPNKPRWLWEVVKVTHGGNSPSILLDPPETGIQRHNHLLLYTKRQKVLLATGKPPAPGICPLFTYCLTQSAISIWLRSRAVCQTANLLLLALPGSSLSFRLIL